MDYSKVNKHFRGFIPVRSLLGSQLPNSGMLLIPVSLLYNIYMLTAIIMAEDFNEVFAIKNDFKFYFAANRVTTAAVPLAGSTPLRLVILLKIKTSLVISRSSAISSYILKRRLIPNPEVVNL